MNKRILAVLVVLAALACMVFLSACTEKVDPRDEADPEAIEIVTGAQMSPEAEAEQQVEEVGVPGEDVVLPATEDELDITQMGVTLEVEEDTGEMTITRPENAAEQGRAQTDVENRADATTVESSLFSTPRAYAAPAEGTAAQTRTLAENYDPDTWTIFVYMCGSNLESNGGAATNDLAEMVNSAGNEQVRFVVEAGGTSRWSGGKREDAQQIRRFLIQEGSITIEGVESQANMGSPTTLTDFLTWGLERYPSEHMGVIMWDHGAGSIGGVCNDENFRNDSLTLRELDSAFAAIYQNMTRKFDFIGFDCCLMSTLETSNIFASYADYMYASEEVEPGAGWDYTSIMDFLAQQPTANGEELGRFVVDSFINYYKKSSDSSFVTMSLIDLSKIDPLVKSFNTFTQELCDVCADKNNVAPIVRGITSAENFGGNNRIEGYTNMIDLGGFVNACAGHVKTAQEMNNAINDAVVYKLAGKTHANASGLSVYYPLAIQGSNEMQTFSDVCVTPFYLTFVDSIGQASVYGAQSSMFDYSSWFDGGVWEQGNTQLFDFLLNPLGGGQDFTSTDQFTGTDQQWGYLDAYQQTGQSSLITFAVKPHFDNQGTYTFQLDQNGLNNASNVTAYVIISAGRDEIELGETCDVYGSWQTGVFTDGFDGKWLSLPDGQNLATYIADETADYVVYTCPILLNGDVTYLRVRQYFATNKVVVEGTWSGVSENGVSGRDLRPLEQGDVITPCYYDFNSDSDEHSYEGNPFAVGANFKVDYSGLSVGTYEYCFIIDDIYNDYLMVDPVIFHIKKNGDIYFEG